MRTAIVSSVYGHYDLPVAPAPQSSDVCDYVLVTDRDYDCPPWRCVVEPRPQLHPRLAAKVAKCRPDVYTEADVSIWIDASVQIQAHDFASWCIQSLGGSLLAQIIHPDRRRISDEADVSASMVKYRGLPCREQARHYLTNGYPDDWGLWATGLIVRRHRPEMAEFGDAWLREQMRWTYQDQLSQAPVLYDLGLRPAELPARLIGDQRFAIRGHRSEL